MQSPDHEQLQQEIVAQFLQEALQSGYPSMQKVVKNIKLSQEFKHYRYKTRMQSIQRVY